MLKSEWYNLEATRGIGRGGDLYTSAGHAVLINQVLAIRWKPIQVPSIILWYLVGGIIIRCYVLGATAWGVALHGRVVRIIETDNSCKRWIRHKRRSSARTVLSLTRSCPTCRQHRLKADRPVFRYLQVAAGPASLRTQSHG